RQQSPLPICHRLFAQTLYLSSDTASGRTAYGKSVKEIAAERNSSVHTITTHKKNIFRKINVNTIYEATKYALRAGLLEMVEYCI
ncbi:MAG: LuxR C-terminal-related transcriptional regulator, partial [Bacteroidaceae bacterium]|nr:LuxR C-terminal-related transcriptional regulator [Bacteroidaceae bacterium]